MSSFSPPYSIDMLGNSRCRPGSATAIRAAVERAGVAGDAIDEVLMGCCLMAGQGQAPARQATLAAGLPQSVGAVTLSKMCGSGMRAMMFAHDMLAAGSASVMVAGGMESMTNAPHLLVGSRKGYRYGAFTTYDHVAVDGLEDAYERGKAMGVLPKQCVKILDLRARRRTGLRSLDRASLKANTDGSFAWRSHRSPSQAKAERPGSTRTNSHSRPSSDKIPGLKPAFKKDSTITAANASSISDGAAAVVPDARIERRKDGQETARADPGAFRCMRRRRTGSRRRRSARSTSRWRKPDGNRATCTCGKSTRPLPR